MKALIIGISLMLFPLTLIVGYIVGSCANVDYVKERAEEKWSKQGFEVIDYEGWEMGCGFFDSAYGGANVWYKLQRINDNGIIYQGCLRRWGDELHVYGPKALDAIKP